MLKYIIAVCASVFVLLLSATLTFHVTILYVYGIAIAAIFTMLCSRTAVLLGSAMGSEEQKEMLDEMTRLREQNRKVSVRLHEMVLELAGAAARIREIAAQN